MNQTLINVDLFNYEAGGHQPDGSFRFAPLATALGPGRRPHLLLLNEAKFWPRRGKVPLLDAAKTLAATLNRPYVGEVGTGALPSALIYDPRLLCLEAWDDHQFPDKRQLAVFSVRATGHRFLVIVDHWSPVDGDARLARAKQLAPYAYRADPVLLGGDFNCTAAGPLPQRDWTQVADDIRPFKGIQAPDGRWGPDTRALDLLIGGWDEQAGRRADGRRFHALCDLAHQTGTPADEAYRPTTNDAINPGGETVNDWLLINKQWRRTGGLVADTYQVHVPPGSTRADYPSDHRRVSAVLALPA